MPLVAAALTAAGFLLPILVPQHRQVQATGRIVCSSKGQQIGLDGVVVNLQEYDMFDPDDFISNSTTGAEGRFYLNGSHTEAGSIDFFLGIGMACDPHGALAKCDRHFRPSKDGHGLELVNRDESNVFCSKECVIMAKVEIPRNYNFQEGDEYPPLFDLDRFDLAAKGKIECDRDIAQAYKLQRHSKKKRFITK